MAKERSGVKWNRREVGEESGEGSIRGGKMEMNEKIATKRNRFSI